ncbi:MAG: hypothetical protein II204_04750, partial [Alistipes sp.]|nr:hypothetical protein [Alistipes sp.]
ERIGYLKLYTSPPEGDFLGVKLLEPRYEVQYLQIVVYKSSMIEQNKAQKATVIWQSLFCVQRDSRSKVSQLFSDLQTLQNVDLSSYKNFLIALYFFAIKNRVRAHQHKIFLLTFAVELEWWC